MDSIIRKLQLLSPGTVIPKPAAKAEFTVKGWGKRNGEYALIYLIPNHRDPQKPYQKGITTGEWEQAYRRLLTTGEFTREWFDAHMLRCSIEGSCNFTTIGGIFSLLAMPPMTAGASTASLYRGWHCQGAQEPRSALATHPLSTTARPNGSQKATTGWRRPPDLGR